MRPQLYKYLLERYEDGRSNLRWRSGSKGNGLVHIDDRGDGDSLTDFCNIFCTVSGKRLCLELTGRFPITDEMSDFAKAHGGFTDAERGMLAVNISAEQTRVVDELAQLVKNTASMGFVVGSAGWFRISARTVSSLLRFGRVLREYFA